MARTLGDFVWRLGSLNLGILLIGAASMACVTQVCTLFSIPETNPMAWLEMLDLFVGSFVDGGLVVGH